MAGAELNAKSEPRTIQRIEVLTGPERRRQWSTEDKDRIVAESYSGADSVSRIARRYGLLPQQLFTWRREARLSATPPAFAAVALAPMAQAEARQPAVPAKHRGSASAKRQMASEVAVEIAAGGITVRVRRGADSSMVAAIVRALKAAS
ncbi:MAG TPA: transposase [Reyranella sp.]